MLVVDGCCCCRCCCWLWWLSLLSSVWCCCCCRCCCGMLRRLSPSKSQPQLVRKFCARSAQVIHYLAALVPHELSATHEDDDNNDDSNHMQPKHKTTTTAATTSNHRAHCGTSKSNRITRLTLQFERVLCKFAHRGGARSLQGPVVDNRSNDQPSYNSGGKNNSSITNSNKSNINNYNANQFQQHQQR